MHAAVRGDEPDYVAPADVMAIGYAAEAIQSTHEDMDRAEAIRQAQTLEEAGHQISGVQELFYLLRHRGLRRAHGQNENE